MKEMVQWSFKEIRNLLWNGKDLRLTVCHVDYSLGSSPRVFNNISMLSMYFTVH